MKEFTLAIMKYYNISITEIGLTPFWNVHAFIAIQM